MPGPSKSTAYRCICPPGFSGAHCEVLVSPNATSACGRAEALLSNSPVCLHGAKCYDAPSGPACACPFGWRGARCEHDLNECLLAAEAFSEEGGLDLTTGAGDPLCNPYGPRRGVCINLPGSYQCNCSLGYAGRNCQIRVSFKQLFVIDFSVSSESAV